MVKIKTGVFISGTGTNLYHLIKNSRDYNFPISVNLIISDKDKAPGIKYAKKYEIPYKIFDTKNKNIFENNALNELIKRKIKLLCLAGFMKILSKKFIMNFGNNIINIHPSLLPKYKGLNTHKRAIKNKEYYSGCSVHFVNHKLDSGKIILKKKTTIDKNDDIQSLKSRILKLEHLAFSQAIRSIYRN